MSERIIYIDQLPSCQTEKFANEGIEVLTPADLNISQLDDDDALIVLCELNIDTNNATKRRSDFYGITLAQQIRRERFKGLILFVSFLSRKQITTNNLKFSILNTIGHSFLKLPVLPLELKSELSKIDFLDDMDWYDIESNYCNVSGLAQQELHRLSGLLNDLSFEKKYLVQEIEKCLNRMGSLYRSDITKFKKELDYSNLIQTIRDVESFCSILIQEHSFNEPISYVNREIKPWGILFLDDEINEKHQLIIELNNYVSSVFCVKSVEEAEAFLSKKNNTSKIALIISDYRLMLKKEDVLVHQKKQGYKFLVETAKKSPYIGLAAFSSMPRRFLLQSFRRMGVKIDIYSKKDYLESNQTRKILIDEFIQKGQDAFNAQVRSVRFSSDKWRYFEPFYEYHRKSPDYDLNERYISNKAKEYCENYNDGNVYFNLVGYTNELKGLNKTPNNVKYFKDFLEKMVCRRAVLWYSRKYAKQPITSPKEIIEFLQGNNYNPKQSNSSATNQINTNLALLLTEFPWNMTVEEKDWLVSQMNLDGHIILKIEKEENDILSYAESIIINSINSSLEFRPNTFVKAKMWINECLNNIHEKNNSNELLNCLNDLKNKIKRTFPIVEQSLSRSVVSFYFYLGRVQKYVKSIENASSQGNLPSSLQEIENYILTRAKKEFAKNSELSVGIEGSILMFFSHLRDKHETYNNKVAFYTRFKEFHKEKSFITNPYRDVSIDEHLFHLTN